MTEIEHIIEEAVSKYWYDTEYQHLVKTGTDKACEDSRKKLRTWIDENLKLFIPKKR